MRPVVGSTLLAIGILVGGVILGVAGIFLFPIVGAIAVIGLLIWMAERKAEHKPPIE